MRNDGQMSDDSIRLLQGPPARQWIGWIMWAMHFGWAIRDWISVIDVGVSVDVDGAALVHDEGRHATEVERAEAMQRLGPADVDASVHDVERIHLLSLDVWIADAANGADE